MEKLNLKQLTKNLENYITEDRTFKYKAFDDFKCHYAFHVLKKMNKLPKIKEVKNEENNYIY